MGSILRRFGRDKFLIILIYCLAGIGLLWMYVGLFPNIRDQYQAYSEVTKAFPEAFLKAFNIENMDFSRLENFLAAEQYSFVWPILACFLTISLGGAAIADEIEKGTMAMLLSMPISRTRLLLSRFIGGAVAITIFVVSSVLSVIPLANAYSIELITERYLTLAILCLVFSLAVYSLALLFSVLFSDRGKVYFATAGTLILMYVVNIVAALKENLTDLRYISFFYYFNASKVLGSNRVDDLSYWVFLGTALVCLPLAIYWFNRRDISV